MADGQAKGPARVVEDETPLLPIIEWDPPVRPFSFKLLLKFMGPGLLMSIAYVDPGNLESDLQTGAKTGYVLLWLLLMTTILGFLLQMQSAKLGVVTGKHLAQHCREQYATVPRLILWVMAEIAIIGSDIQEVIGSAIAISLLSGGYIPLWAGVLITASDAFVLLYLERFGVRLLEALFAIMIGVMVVTFGIMYVHAAVPFNEVLHGFFVPSLPTDDVPTAVALVGSLLMPHNIYLHSALVQSRQHYSTSDSRKREAVRYFSIESALSLAAAVVINLFVVAVFARGFYQNPDAPDEIGLQNAGHYLGATYGQATVFIWALGLLAAGQSSTMTGTYTGQFVMQGYLDLKISPGARIAVTRAVAIVPTLSVALMYQNSDTKLDALNQNLNLLQSIQLPFALVPLLCFTSTPAIMGKAFVNAALTSSLTCAIALLVVAINALAVYGAIMEHLSLDTPVQLVLVLLAVFLYVSFLIYLVISHFLAPPMLVGRKSPHDQRAQASGPAAGADGDLSAPLLGDGAEGGQEEVGDRILTKGAVLPADSKQPVQPEPGSKESNGHA